MSLYAFIYVNVLSNPTLFLVDHPVSFGNMSHYESKMGCEQQFSALAAILEVWASEVLC